jgi:predicted TIM-barrel fold metal-dependent hydrolase
LIFDAHTHWSDSWQLPDRTDPSRWLSVWDRHGIAAGAVCPLAGLENDRRLSQDNEEVAAAAARSVGRMIPFCTVNPYAGGDAVHELERCHRDLKMRGLKLHPWLQGFSLGHPAVDLLCEAAEAFQMPILFHDGTPCFSLPSQVAWLARRHPRVTFVLGHCGIFQHWREALAAMRYTENLWGCLCGSYTAALREIVRRGDTSRLLWGSDHGFGTSDLVGYRLKLLDLTGLTPQQQQAIHWENARRLLGL